MSSKDSQRPRRRPVQARSKETVAVILEGAAQVFAECGYAGATTNHIAERAGVSVGSIYQYFPNKDALLGALLERHLEQAGGAIAEQLASLRSEAGQARAGVEASAEAGLRLVIEQVVELHANDPELHRVLLLEAPRLPELVDRLHRVEEAIALAVSGALQQHFGLEEAAAGRAAYLIVHSVELLAHEYVTHPPADMAKDAFVDELVLMVGAYIEAKRGATTR